MLKMNGSEFCQWLRTEPLKARAEWKMAQEKARTGSALRREKGAPRCPKQNRATSNKN